MLVIANSRSGRGGGTLAAARIRRHLESGGKHRARIIEVGSGSDPTEFAGVGDSSMAVVVAGGDGSVHHNAQIAIRTGMPLYHFPCGNENLFAREFGANRSLARLSAALDGSRTRLVDLARIDNGTHFVLMASFGCDASVVHRLDAARSRATGHLAYVMPVLAELRRPLFPRLKVEVEGKTVVDGQRGMLIVANSRQYALRIDPACNASMTDGMLDVVFLPCRGVASVLACGLACRLRLGHRIRGVVQTRGRRVAITTCDGAVPYQVDGEAPVRATDGGVLKGTMVIGVDAGVLPVLLP